MKNVLKKVCCATLSVCMLSSAVVFADSSTNDKTKDETVYVMQNLDGSVRNQIISSWIHSDDGIKNVSEKLDMSDIKNVTGDVQPTIDGDNVKWDTNENDVYYQGSTEKTPPISMDITYKLDGKEVVAKDIAGKTGKIEISIKYKNNLKSQETVNDKKRDIYTPLAAATVCNFDTDVFKNVKCENAKVLSDGNNQVVTIVSMPGIKESLGSSYEFISNAAEINLNDEFTITADATNFELSPIMTGVMPITQLKEVKNSLDKNKLITSVKAMKQGVTQIVDGTAQLSTSLNEYSKKMNELEKSYQAFGAGIGKISAGANDLSAGAKQMSAGITEYTKKITDTFSGILAKMDGVEKQISGLKQTTTADLTKLGADVQTTSKEMKSIMTDLGKLIAQIDALEASGSVDSSVTNGLKMTANSMYQQLQEHITTLGTIGEDVKKIAGTAEKLSGDLNEQYKQVKQQLAPIQKQLTDSSALLNGAANKVAKGASDLKAGADGLKKGSDQVNNGIKQLNGASKTLAQKTGELNSGVVKFKTEAIDKMSNGMGEQLTDVETIMQVNNIFVEKAEDYNSYTGSPENFESSLKFVMKTDEIEVEEVHVDAETEKVEEKKGFWQTIVDFFKNLFS